MHLEQGKNAVNCKTTQTETLGRISRFTFDTETNIDRVHRLESWGVFNKSFHSNPGLLVELPTRQDGEAPGLAAAAAAGSHQHAPGIPCGTR